jgi:hypothetical protein
VPNASTSPEASAIQDAYADQLKLLFSTLCTNMASLSEQESLANFTNGFNKATRARTLALGVVPAMPTANVLARSTKLKAKSSDQRAWRRTGPWSLALGRALIGLGIKETAAQLHATIQRV